MYPCHPVIFDRILASKQSGKDVKVFLVDPRKNPVRGEADVLQDPIPGYDLALFHAMAYVIIKEKIHNPEFIAKHVQFKKVSDGKPVKVSFEEYVKFLEPFAPAKAAMDGLKPNSM